MSEIKLSKPLITVVTVVYNDAAHIEQTILSVLNQTYPNIEYIIIDGGSTDGTVDIIKKYADRLAYWVSEPDKGIYDAMNKGIDKATGEWVNFMNSGDCFVRNISISTIFVQDYYGIDIIYGDCIRIFDFGCFYHKSQDINKIEQYFPFCHQSVFVRNKIIKMHKFDLKYSICADYNQFLILYRQKYKFFQMPICVSAVTTDGISKINDFQRTKEDELLKHENISLMGYIKLLKIGIKKIIKLIVFPYLSNGIKIKRCLLNKNFRKVDYNDFDV